MSATAPGGGARVILAFDTATTQVVVALGTPDGALIEAQAWPAGYRHGETLLPAIASLLARHDLARTQIGAVVVGTGPGAFTGLRVGLATAKGLAHGLAVPIVGIGTGEALLAGAPPGSVLVLPAGPADRLIVRAEAGVAAQLLPAGLEPELADTETLVALDLPDRAPEDALARGEAARAILGATLIALGSARLAAGTGDDLAALVPAYVSLPRGVRSESGEVAWSRDPR